jgi:hypothetical protein
VPTSAWWEPPQPGVEASQHGDRDHAAGYGADVVLAALQRAVGFRRWWAADLRGILAAGGAAPTPRRPVKALMLTLPTVPTRPLSAYKINTSEGDS